MRYHLSARDTPKGNAPTTSERGNMATLAKARRPDRPSLDIIVPLCNEEDVLSALLASLARVFAPDNLTRTGVRSVHYIFVDDGSADRSAEILSDAISAGLPATLYRLSRNFGHQNAVSAGLDFAHADVVAVIDADLQDPPELILDMVARWREGYDVVFARRQRRKENPLRNAGAWLFYRLVAFLADIRIPLDSGDFCLMDRRVVAIISRLPERLRFPRGLRAWAGFRQTGIDYDRPARRAGRSKYGLSKLYRLATDGVVSSSIRPLQIAQVASVSFLGLSLLVGTMLLLQPRSLGIPPAILGVYLLIILGNLVQVFCIYLLGAYVGRTYLEVKGRPSYVVMEVIGDGPAEMEGRSSRD
jgi:glycosyltransferase involved in cell wall biosynthesis